MQSEFISDGSLKSIAARGGVVLLDKGCFFNPLTLKISLVILLTVSQSHCVSLENLVSDQLVIL